MTHTVESLMALARDHADWVALDSAENGYQQPPAEYPSTPEVAASLHTFESALREALRAEYLRGIDAAAKAIAPKYAAAPIVGVGQTYSGSISSCGCSTYTDSAGNVHPMQCYMHAILALKD
jgi:hypothetical protein